MIGGELSFDWVSKVKKFASISQSVCPETYNAFNLCLRPLDTAYISTLRAFRCEMFAVFFCLAALFFGFFSIRSLVLLCAFFYFSYFINQYWFIDTFEVKVSIRWHEKYMTFKKLLHLTHFHV